MIIYKSIEMKRGTTTRLTFLLQKADPILRHYYSRFRSFISYFNRKSALALVQWIAYHILSWARAGYIWLHRKAHAHPPSKKVIDMVRGKGESGNIGGASFYLKKISEDNAR